MPDEWPLVAFTVVVLLACLALRVYARLSHQEADDIYSDEYLEHLANRSAQENS